MTAKQHLEVLKRWSPRICERNIRLNEKNYREPRTTDWDRKEILDDFACLLSEIHYLESQIMKDQGYRYTGKPSACGWEKEE